MKTNHVFVNSAWADTKACRDQVGTESPCETGHAVVSFRDGTFEVSGIPMITPATQQGLR